MRIVPFPHGKVYERKFFVIYYIFASLKKEYYMKEPVNNNIMLYSTAESHKLPSDFLGRYHIIFFFNDAKI